MTPNKGSDVYLDQLVHNHIKMFGLSTQENPII
jgi:hypothetical protein